MNAGESRAEPGHDEAGGVLDLSGVSLAEIRELSENDPSAFGAALRRVLCSAAEGERLLGHDSSI
ncbi:hypothetical protein [Bailinhaonella thermotolerans]|uniref:FXSXX-COOH protein n=1 Tax=Bailinhaonella thermotolerans TaxID=1070861 RepID=A0A3A4AVS7_9ACTN|nr:hypothetical protein [Bailinhaonella thermotolerans]RJL29983.1 hypothetical protein D5H75_23875 [Bailinhaonella thermotolerans]